MKFQLILFFIVLISDFAYIIYQWNDYKYRIKSGENAIINLDLAMNKIYQIDLLKSNFKDRKYKIINLGEEIEKYGIHAIFCEIPGTLPSKNANPESFVILLETFTIIIILREDI